MDRYRLEVLFRTNSTRRRRGWTSFLVFPTFFATAGTRRLPYSQLSWGCTGACGVFHNGSAFSRSQYFGHTGTWRTRQRSCGVQHQSNNFVSTSSSKVGTCTRELTGLSGPDRGKATGLRPERHVARTIRHVETKSEFWVQMRNHDKHVKMMVKCTETRHCAKSCGHVCVFILSRRILQRHKKLGMATLVAPPILNYGALMNFPALTICLFASILGRVTRKVLTNTGVDHDRTKRVFSPDPSFLRSATCSWLSHSCAMHESGTVADPCQVSVDIWTSGAIDWERSQTHAGLRGTHSATYNLTFITCGIDVWEDEQTSSSATSSFASPRSDGGRLIVLA